MLVAARSIQQQKQHLHRHILEGDDETTRRRVSLFTTLAEALAQIELVEDVTVSLQSNETIIQVIRVWTLHKEV